jgi:hypothetical protein
MCRNGLVELVTAHANRYYDFVSEWPRWFFFRFFFALKQRYFCLQSRDFTYGKK